MPITVMSPEHKAKISAARAAYWVVEKARRAKLKEEALLNPIAPERFTGRVGTGGAKPTKHTVAVAREEIVEEINRNKKELLKAQIESAKGLHYINAEGKVVYTKVPNTAAGEYLLNQLIGKPKESIEIKSTNLNVDL